MQDTRALYTRVIDQGVWGGRRIFSTEVAKHVDKLWANLRWNGKRAVRAVGYDNGGGTNRLRIRRGCDPRSAGRIPTRTAHRDLPWESEH
jgi:hypothetical protein